MIKSMRFNHVDECFAFMDKNNIEHGLYNILMNHDKDSEGYYYFTLIDKK